MIFASRRETIHSVFAANGGRAMATIRLAVGLLGIIHPLFPGVGVSLTVCVIGLALVASAFLPTVDNDDAHDLDFST
jgi:hypothetical protein